jgi:hypothetical protein
MKMQVFQNGINGLAAKLPIGAILLLVIGLNAYWTLTLAAIGPQFEQIANAPLLDLQNVMGVLSAEDALALVNTYSTEARSFYWQFFTLDNLMPPLVFGSFALLWAWLLQRFPGRWTWLSSSPLLFVPFGVGFFDILENLCFVLVMSADPTAALPIMQTGLTFVALKAICLFATFGLTPVLALVAIGTEVGKRVRIGEKRLA